MEGGEVCLLLSPGIPEARVLDLSASGGSIVSPPGSIEEISYGSVVMQAGDYPPFTLKLDPVRFIKESGLALVGVRFEQLDQGALKYLSRYLMDRFLEQSRRISRPVAEAEISIGNFQRKLVHRLLRFHTISRGQRVRVYHGDLLLPLALEVREMTVEAARQLIVAEVLAGSAAMLKRGEEYTFAFSGANAVNCFKTEIWRSDPRRVMILLPPDIRQAGFRESFRVGLSEGPHLEVFFKHPRMPGLHLAKHVLDVSARGFSFPLDLNRDMLFPGERIKHVSIKLPEGQVRTEAVIRSILRLGESSGFSCGVEILGFRTEREAEHWKRFVFQLGFPRTKLGGGSTVGEAWEILRSSGYVNEATEELRPYLARRFFVSWKKHSEKLNLGRYILFLKNGRPVGTVAGSLIYPHTWLVHHFGIDEQQRKMDRQDFFKLAREAYCGMHHLLSNMAPIEYFVIYADSGMAWNQIMYGDFLRRSSARNEFVYDEYSVYKHMLRSVLLEPVPRPSSVEIVGGSQELERVLSRTLKARLHAVEFEAFCYKEREIGLFDFSRKCASEGYERERQIFFAVEGGKALAAMVAEIGDEGINIFGLFNKCWFVYIDPRTAQDDWIKERLLRRVISYYAERGKKEFIFLDNEGDISDKLLKSLDFRHVARGFRFLARTTILPAWMSYSDETIGILSG